jgi:hypothetical protein
MQSLQVDSNITNTNKSHTSVERIAVINVCERECERSVRQSQRDEQEHLYLLVVGIQIASISTATCTFYSPLVFDLESSESSGWHSGVTLPGAECQDCVQWQTKKQSYCASQSH